MQSHAPHANPKLSHSIAACRPELLRGARQLVGLADADDLIQSTFERALRSRDSFQPDTNLLAWLRRIMSNLTVDGWRHQNRHPTCGLDEQREQAAAPPESPAPWEELTGADIAAAAAELPKRFREVFELHAQGRSYAEISARLNLPTGTVGTRLLRARKQLRKSLTATLAQRSAAGTARRNPPVQMTIAAKQIGRVVCANDQLPVADSAAAKAEQRRLPARPAQAPARPAFAEANLRR